MGFSSWECKGCGRSLVHDPHEGHLWMMPVAILEDDGGRIFGTFDCYGTVTTKSGADFELGDDPCCYHRSCWNALGRPDYDGPSEMANDQGHFYDDADYNFPEPKTPEDVTAAMIRWGEIQVANRAKRQAERAAHIKEKEARGEEIPDWMRL